MCDIANTLYHPGWREQAVVRRREREKSLSSKRDGSLGGSDALPLKERLNVASWLLSEGRRGGEVSGKLLLSTEANSLL